MAANTDVYLGIFQQHYVNQMINPELEIGYMQPGG
jgi:hypothetical protein